MDATRPLKVPCGVCGTKSLAAGSFKLRLSCEVELLWARFYIPSTSPNTLSLVHGLSLCRPLSPSPLLTGHTRTTNTLLFQRCSNSAQLNSVWPQQFSCLYICPFLLYTDYKSQLFIYLLIYLTPWHGPLLQANQCYSVHLWVITVFLCIFWAKTNNKMPTETFSNSFSTVSKVCSKNSYILSEQFQFVTRTVNYQISFLHATTVYSHNWLQASWFSYAWQR